MDLPRSSATKRKRRKIFESPPQEEGDDPVQSEAAPSTGAPWMQQPWPPAGTSQQQQWMVNQAALTLLGQQMLGNLNPSSWLQPQQAPNAQPSDGPSTKTESEARAGRRAIRKETEERVEARRTQGQKPHRVRVKVGGGIDGGCEGKNEFDEALRSLVPRILDVNCVKWNDQLPNSVEKLRSAIDAEFEYVGGHLSEKGFKNAVKRQMKTERSKMKG